MPSCCFHAGVHGISSLFHIFLLPLTANYNPQIPMVPTGLTFPLTLVSGPGEGAFRPCSYTKGATSSSILQRNKVWWGTGALRPDQPSSCFSSNRGYRLRDMLCYGCLINDEDMVLVCTNILPFLTVAKLSSTRKLGSRVTLEGTSAGGGTQDSKCWSSTTCHGFNKCTGSKRDQYGVSCWFIVSWLKCQPVSYEWVQGSFTSGFSSRARRDSEACHCLMKWPQIVSLFFKKRHLMIACLFYSTPEECKAQLKWMEKLPLFQL